jgi:hypothetical protein
MRTTSSKKHNFYHKCLDAEFIYHHRLNSKENNNFVVHVFLSHLRPCSYRAKSVHISICRSKYCIIYIDTIIISNER